MSTGKMLLLAPPKMLVFAGKDVGRRREKESYSSIKKYCSCPRSYHIKYNLGILKKITGDNLWYGKLIHSCLERWYMTGSPEEVQRLAKLKCSNTMKFDKETAKKLYQHCVACMSEYIKKYEDEDKECLKIIKLEQKFKTVINGYNVGGFVDSVAEIKGESVLFEHKTTSHYDDNYRDGMRNDLQTFLYARALQTPDRPIKKVIYNVLVKSLARQKEGETEQVFKERKAELAKKNKSGKSNAKRNMPETDQDFQKRLRGLYSGISAKGEKKPMFHRFEVDITDEKIAAMEQNITEISKTIDFSDKQNLWPRYCQSCYNMYGNTCDYLPLCQNGITDETMKDYEFKKGSAGSENT